MKSLTISDPQKQRATHSLMQWWLDAGVHDCMGDDTVDRLAPPPKPVATTPTVVPAPAPQQKKLATNNIADAVTEAEKLANAATTFDELKIAIEGFNGCPLRTPQTNTVIWRGNPNANFLIIGEGPGAEEDKQGLPFVGKSGQLLDKILAATKISTEEVLITNTVYWRPPGNRKPNASEMAICQPFVRRVITLMKPKAIMLAGGAAASSVLGIEKGILSVRGQWHHWEDKTADLRIPILPTLHPAFLLRQPLMKKKAWADMLAISEKL